MAAVQARTLRTSGSRIVRRRWPAFVVVLGATALGTLAMAQPRGKSPSRSAKPAATKVDAASPPEGEGASTMVDAGTSSSPGAPPVPPPADLEITDGGARPSPLNPAAQEFPQAHVDAGAPVDYERLLADIAALRARVSAVSDNLYQSRVSVAVQTEGDHAKVARLTVSLDDGVVYAAPANFVARELTTVYDHAVAPGRHAVTVEVERKDDRDDGFRNAQKNRFTVDVPRDHRTEVQVRVIDDSDMGKAFPADKNGRYDLRLRVRAVAKPVGK